MSQINFKRQNGSNILEIVLQLNLFFTLKTYQESNLKLLNFCPKTILFLKLA